MREKFQNKSKAFFFFFFFFLFAIFFNVDNSSIWILNNKHKNMYGRSGKSNKAFANTQSRFFSVAIKNLNGKPNKFSTPKEIAF